VDLLLRQRLIPAFVKQEPQINADYFPALRASLIAQHQKKSLKNLR
jgi:hypothetical protein